MPISKKVNKDFFKEWTPQMAYILGFFAADGYVTVNKRGGQFWCIPITDFELLVSIRKTVGSNHKIGIRKSKNKNESTLYILQIGSREMCNDLRKLGFGELKTKRMNWPPIPKDFVPHFVRGYFDGDGNVWSGISNPKRAKPVPTLKTAFTSCSKGFLERLFENLLYLGLKDGLIYTLAKAGCSRLQLNTKSSLKLYEIMYNSGAFGELFLDRKKQTFEAFIKMRT